MTGKSLKRILLSLALTFGAAATLSAASENATKEEARITAAHHPDPADGLWQAAYFNAVIDIRKTGKSQKPTLKAFRIDPSDKRLHEKFIASARKRNAPVLSDNMTEDKISFLNEILKKVDMTGNAPAVWTGQIEVEILGVATKVKLTVRQVNQDTLEIKASKFAVLSHTERWTRVNPASGNEQLANAK